MDISLDIPEGLVVDEVLSRTPRGVVSRVRRGDDRLVLRVGVSGTRSVVSEASVLGRVAGQVVVLPTAWGVTAGGRPYVLRPWIDGRPFDQAVAQEPIDRIVALIRELLGGLADLHEAGLLHRDIKAGNVLVSEGHVHLVDFEFATEAGRSAGPAGSPLHMAPEVLLGRPHRVASDLFSVGVMLSVACVGPAKPDFHARFPARSFWVAAGLDPASLDARLAPLVEALVRRHPDDRPFSARDALAMLEGGTMLMPPIEIPFLAGRVHALRRLAERIASGESDVIAIGVADAEEEVPLLDALQIELARSGVSSRRPPADATAPFDFAWMEQPRQGAVLIGRDDLAPGESAADLALASLRSSPRNSGGRVLALPPTEARELATTLRHRGLDSEVGDIVHLTWPRLSLDVLTTHIDRLAQGASPDVAARLAESLLALTDGRRAHVNACLARAADDGVWRQEDGAVTLLRSEWPAADGVDVSCAGPWSALDDRQRAIATVLALFDHSVVPDVVAGVVGFGVTADLARLRAVGLVAGGDEAGRPTVSLADRRWRAWIADRLAVDERRAIEERCEAALREAGAPAARVARHRLARAETESDLLDVSAVIEEELEAGRLGVARALLQGVRERSRSTYTDLTARVALLDARLELAQGRSANALETLTAHFGDALERAPIAVRRVAALAAEQSGARTRARALFASVRDDEHASRADRLAGLTGYAYGLFLDGAWEAALVQTEGALHPNDPPVAAAALLNLRGVALTRLHRFDQAEAMLKEALAQGQAGGDPLSMARSRLNLAHLDRRRGRYADAVDSLEAAATAFGASGHVQGRALALNNLGVLKRDLGELRSARELLRQALALRLRCGDAHGAASSHGSLALVELDAGHVGVSLAAIQKASELMTRGAYSPERSLLKLASAIALAVAGRHVEAAAQLAPAESPTRPDHAALAARAEAVVHHVAGQNDLALTAARHALAAATEDGDGAERFRCGALLAMLAPNDESAATAMRESAELLDVPVRRAEAVFRTTMSPSPEQIEEWLAEFERAGRSDLVVAAARALSRACDRLGDISGRRRAASRAAEALDAVTEGLPAVARDATAQRVERLVGGGGDAGVVDPPAAWFLSCNRRLAREEDLDGLLLAIVDMALQLTGARRGFLVLLEGDRLIARVARGMEDGSDESRFSRTVVREAMSSGQTLLSTDASADRRFSGTASIDELNLRSVLCVPLSLPSGAGGALYVDDDRREAAFDETDEVRVAGLADQAAAAITNLRRRAEIEALNQRLAERVEFQAEELSRTRAQLRRSGQVAPAGGMIGESEAMRRVHALVERLAPTDLGVLVTGPSGSGKDLVARALHERSHRAAKPFVVENISALPANLLESELFGHVRGAFTGADRDRPGLFAEADGGSFFLDEIGEMPLELQSKLLRVLETGELRPVGSRKSVRVDVRILAATNRDLARRVREGAFREDLYYRLNAAEIRLPPLAERLEDIPLLVGHFLARLNEKHGTARVISPEVVLALVRRPWPGQVRELSHEVARLYFLSTDGIVDTSLLRAPASAPLDEHGTVPASLLLVDAERMAIERALAAANGRKDRAAKLLGISRAGLYAKLKRLAIEI